MDEKRWMKRDGKAERGQKMVIGRKGRRMRDDGVIERRGRKGEEEEGKMKEGRGRQRGQRETVRSDHERERWSG